MPLWTPTAEPSFQFAVVYRAAANLPQTTLGALFKVCVGLCHVTVVGRVTTALETGANNAKLVADPTTGADTDLCTAADIDGLALGKWVFATSAAAALQKSASSACTFSNQFPDHIGQIHAIGNISLNTTASKTGQMEWWAQWFPLEPGAYVVSV